MASAPAFTFDLIDAAGYGYHRVWQERVYLFKLALVPLVIKFALTLVVYGLNVDTNILRGGLVLLPGVFAQGWVMAQFLRTLLLEERWPMPLPERNDEMAIKKLILRARGIISATLVFVLISLVTTVSFWALLMVNQSAETADAAHGAGGDPGPGGSPVFFIPAVLLMGGAIWAFRLLWLYIPYAVLMPARDYLLKIRGFAPSLKMFGLFLIAIIPSYVLALGLTQMVVAPFGQSLAEAPALVRFAIVFFSVTVDMATALIATASMAYALRDVVPRHPAALANVKS